MLIFLWQSLLFSLSFLLLLYIKNFWTDFTIHLEKCSSCCGHHSWSAAVGCKGKEWHLEPFFFVLSSEKALVKWQNLCSVKISVHLHSWADSNSNSNPVMTIIMIIMNNRGQSYGSWEADLWDLCLIFSMYGSVLLDSHWNQWDSFQQLPWSLAGSLNCLLKQGKINRAVGSSSADDWIDTLKFPSTFREEAGKGQECRGGSCSADEQTAALFLSDSSRASEEFHPMIFTVWCSGFDDLDPEITAYTSVENDTFLWRQNHFSFRADLGLFTLTDAASWAPGGLCSQALCVESLHALMVVSPAAGTPHFFGIRRGTPKLFTEELLLTHTAHGGQIPLHWAGGLGQLQQRHLHHQSVPWSTLQRKVYTEFSALDFPRLPFGDFPGLFLCPEVVPLGAVQPQSKKTKSTWRNYSQTKRNFLGCRETVNQSGQEISRGFCGSASCPCAEECLPTMDRLCRAARVSFLV